MTMPRKQIKRILLVDDEPEFAKPHVEALEDADYTVKPVMDPNTTIEELDKHIYDLVILDLLMPPLHKDLNDRDRSPRPVLRETGVEVYKQIRAIKGFQEIPVIILSVVRDPVIRDKLLIIDEDRSKIKLLTKPILPSELINAIRSFQSD
jgi:CheY-like chemotaxis protein